MSEAEIADLKKEAGRLNQIISILLKQNELLENEISYLKTGGASPGFSISNEKKMVGVPDFGNSNEKIWVGNTESWNPDNKMLVGNTEAGNSNDKITVGNTEVWNSDPKIRVGIPEEKTAHSNIIAPVPNYNWAFAARLRKNGFLTVNGKGLRNIGTLLIHFYNKGRGDYPTLRKITGLSKGGLAKTIMSLKKRGVIHRTAYKEYALSEPMRNFIAEAFRV